MRERFSNILASAMVLCTTLASAAEFGLYFGNGGTVELPTPEVHAAAKQLTVECRFKLYATPTQPLKLVWQWSEDRKEEDGGRFHLSLLPANQLSFTLVNGTGVTETVIGKSKLELDKWYHVAATWNGTELSLFLDGKSLATKKPPRFETLFASRLPLTIGPPASKNPRSITILKGFIADVAVWSAARSADSLAKKEPLAGSEHGLLSWLSLSEAILPEKVIERVTSTEAKLSPKLGPSSWCLTSAWHEPPAASQLLPLFLYDLGTAARQSGVDQAEATLLNRVSRLILVSNFKTQQAGVLWQDQASKSIFITWINPDYSSHETTRLKSMGDSILMAGTTDPLGNLYYVEIQAKTTNGEDDPPLKAFFHGAGPTGAALGEKSLDMSKKGFNVWNYAGPWQANLTYHNGALAMILPHLMYRTSDGLNHQHAVAIVFSAKDPSVFKNFGQITGHSFGNFLSVNSRGEFLGLDLGDNSPRGVNLHRFTGSEFKSRVVYTYKTAHGTAPRNDSPVYEELSRGDKKFYKWSNDNNTYTDLGGVVEGKLSYSVVFSTERSLEGRSLDNTRAFSGSRPRPAP